MAPGQYSVAGPSARCFRPRTPQPGPTACSVVYVPVGLGSAWLHFLRSLRLGTGGRWGQGLCWHHPLILFVVSVHGEVDSALKPAVPVICKQGMATQASAPGQGCGRPTEVVQGQCPLGLLEISCPISATTRPLLQPLWRHKRHWKGTRPGSAIRSKGGSRWAGRKRDALRDLISSGGGSDSRDGGVDLGVWQGGLGTPT